MTDLPEEILQYHKLQSKIAEMEVGKSKLEKEIIEKYCPYKPGMKIKYTQWWRKGDIKFGQIERISFEGIQEGAIDNKWILSVRPLNKNLKRSKRIVLYAIDLGEHEGDKVIEIISEQKATA